MDGGRPSLLPSDDERTDPRVTAVREVLAGETVSEVARRHAVDVAVLHRWVTAFVEAGTAQVTNRPQGESARQRDRFLATFAHEIRTPLTSARGWVDVLREGQLPPDRVGPTLARLDEALARLAERARDVELLAAASLGLVRPHPVSVALEVLLADLDVVLDPDARGSLVVDPDLMGRVLRDLVTAARLPPTPSSLMVELHVTGAWREVRVVRRGGAVPPAVLQALFDPFDHGADGSGITIGLYLARALAVAHGGAVGVDQDEQSTTFWVRVPDTSGSEETP